MRELGNYLQERENKTRIEFKPSNIFPRKRNEEDTSGINILRRKLSKWIKKCTGSERLFVGGFEIIVLRDSDNPLYAAIKLDSDGMDDSKKLQFLADVLKTDVKQVVATVIHRYSEYNIAVSNARIQSKVITKQQSAISKFCNKMCSHQSTKLCNECPLLKAMSMPEQKRLVFFKETEICV